MEQKESTDLVQLKVHGVVHDPDTDTRIVILRDAQNSELLPIWVGAAEGIAIKMALEGIVTPRPMSHDLIRSMADHLNVQIVRVVVTDVKNSTYYAAIHLLSRGTEHSVDARPSDAIALALRTNSPIYVTQDVLKRRGAWNLDAWLEKLDAKNFGTHEV